MKNGIFITGTDTEVGKTIIAAGICPLGAASPLKSGKYNHESAIQTPVFLARRAYHVNTRSYKSTENQTLFGCFRVKAFEQLFVPLVL